MEGCMRILKEARGLEQLVSYSSWGLDQSIAPSASCVGLCPLNPKPKERQECSPISR